MVAGLLFNGMSMIVVMPPAAAALVAVSMPGSRVSPQPCCEMRHAAACMQMGSTFPVGAAGLVHVNVGVNEARRYDEVAVVQDAAQTRQQVCCVRKVCQGCLPIDGLHGSDLAVHHAHCATLHGVILAAGLD